jgi:hypothetical protein
MQPPEVRVVEWPGTPTAVIRETTTWEEFPALWGGLLDEVWQTVREHGLPAGRNVMRYLDDVPTVEVGVELSGFEGIGRVLASSLPAGPAATARVPSTRDGIRAGHEAVARYVQAHGLTRGGGAFEVYDHQRGDPGTLQMDVYWPLGQAATPHKGV